MKITKEEKERKKDEILKILKKDSLSTSKIAHEIKSNYWFALELLEELEKEKKIKGRFKAKGKFWILIKLTGGDKDVDKVE